MNDDQSIPPYPTEPPSTASTSPPTSPSTGETAAGDAPTTSSGGNKRNARSWIAAAVVTSLVAAGAVFFVGRSSNDADASGQAGAGQASSANGQTGGGSSANRGPGAGRGGVNGTLVSIDGTMLELRATTQSGETETTVLTTEDTVVSETVDASLSALSVGDTVTVLGTAADGAVAATSIIAGDTGTGFGPGPAQGGGPPEGFEPPEGMTLPDGATPPSDGSGRPGGFGGGMPTRGTITAVDESTITVQTDDGSTVQVTTTADTTVRERRTISPADLEVGDTLRVMGSNDGSTVTATSIERGDLAFAGAGGPPFGGGQGG